MVEYSVSPAGEKFPLPAKEEYAAEYERLERLAAAARKEGKEVVVVMGIGFVGAVMAAIVADSTDKKGRPNKLVIGCQRPARAATGRRRFSGAESRRSRPRIPKSTP